MNRVPGRNEALQRMKIETRQIHLLGRVCGVQAVEPEQDALM
jgi:hypothetical protein